MEQGQLHSAQDRSLNCVAPATHPQEKHLSCEAQDPRIPEEKKKKKSQQKCSRIFTLSDIKRFLAKLNVWFGIP